MRQDLSAASSSTELVLVIDDEVDLLQTYERLLRRMGCDVVAAASGQEGLSIARARRVALAIVDLKLPDIDSLAVMQALRAGPAPPSIIVVTGFISPATRQAALDAGAVGFLWKPFSVLAFAALVRNVLAAQP